MEHYLRRRGMWIRLLGSLLGCLLGLVLGTETAAELVVEKIAPESALAIAGLREGDRLDHWELVTEGPSWAPRAAGELRSAFEWTRLEVEWAPRGNIRLKGYRGSTPLSLVIRPGRWSSAMRPGLTEAEERIYQAVLEDLAKRETTEVVTELQALLSEHSEEMEEGLPAWLFLRLGESLNVAGKLAEAEDSYRAALSASQSPQARATILSALATCQSRQGHFGLAEETLRQAEAVVRKAWGDSLWLARVLNQMGALAAQRWQQSKAEDLFQTALSVQRRVASGSLAEAKTLNNLGLTARMGGDFEKAIEFFQQSLEIKRAASQDSLGVATTIYNLGSLYSDRGDLDLAAAHLEESLDLRRRLEADPFDLARGLGQLGAVLSEVGDQEKAAALLREALEILEKHAPGSLDLGTTFGNLGVVSIRAGDPEQALHRIERSLEIFEHQIPDSVCTSTLLWHLSEVRGLQGYLDRQEPLLRRALEIARRSGLGGAVTARILTLLGGLLIDQGDLEPARLALEEAQKIFAVIAPEGLAAADALYELGRTAMAAGRLGEAEGLLEKALAIRRRYAPASLGAAQVLDQLARLGQAQGHTVEAWAHALSAVETLEEQGRHLGLTPEHRADFRSRLMGVYQTAIGIGLDLGEIEEAFHLLEKSRGRSFLELLSESKSPSLHPLPKELEKAQRRNELLSSRAMEELHGLSRTSRPDQVIQIERRIAELQRERRELAVRIRQAHPKSPANLIPRALRAAEARSVLDSKTLALVFNVTEGRTDIFLVSSEEPLQVVSLSEGATDLQGQVEAMIQAIQEIDTGVESEAWRLGDELYRRLLRPVEGAMGRHRRLLIVPDGPLHRLPFGALVRSKALDQIPSHRAAAPWQYLVEWRPLHFSLSISAFAQTRQTQQERPAPTRQKLVVAFGDPGMIESDTGEALRVASTKPLAAEQISSSIQAWPPLPHARREVETLKDFYPGARILVGEEASEKQVRALGPRAHRLHFATHVLLDDRFPMSSSLVLSQPSSQAQGTRRALLQAWQIAEQVQLDADLVVLSGCGSATGPELRGEGLLGLTRAFQIAGARTVAASLWQVADVTTAELMVRFHRQLSQGRTKDEALRAAQMELLKEPILIHPESGESYLLDASAPWFWSAFQVYGDWR